MLAKLSDKLFRRNFKRFADSQQGEDGKWTSGFDHLPMTHAEAVRIHVLLAQLTFRSVRSNPMAQGAKESRIVGRKVSGGAHSFRVRQTRAKEPRARLRFVCYMRRKAMGHSPPAQWRLILLARYRTSRCNAHTGLHELQRMTDDAGSAVGKARQRED
jgi:hypothetical protein